jgi:ADP-ribose pyrophosphatase YjhB (NUDIX family)
MVKQLKEPKAKDTFHIVLLGVIYDPKERKILIIRKNGDPELGKKFSWGFPGTELFYNKDPDVLLKQKLKEKTGYEVKNLGAIFTKVYPENKKVSAIYFLCEVFSGTMKKGKFYTEIKWVRPEEIESYFTTSFHKRLREYILNLK